MFRLFYSHPLYPVSTNDFNALYGIPTFSINPNFLILSSFYVCVTEVSYISYNLLHFSHLIKFFFITL